MTTPLDLLAWVHCDAYGCKKQAVNRELVDKGTGDSVWLHFCQEHSQVGLVRMSPTARSKIRGTLDATPPQDDAGEEIEWLIANFHEAVACVHNGHVGPEAINKAEKELRAAVRQLAADKQRLERAVATGIKRIEVHIAERDAAREELAKAKEEIAVLSEPDDLSDDLRHVEKLLAEAFVGKHTTIIGKGVLEQWKRNMEAAQAELAALKRPDAPQRAVLAAAEKLEETK